MQGEFKGFFAEVYDIIHARLCDVDAYVSYARQFGPKVLELGSGTGRILIPLARAGCQVTGVDLSDDMVHICREKLKSESTEVQRRVTIVKGSVTNLELNDAFDLVIAPCNLINCLTEPGEGLALLRSAKRHLRDGGVFILDNSIPDVPAMVRSNGVIRTFEFTHPVTGTKITDTFTAFYDFCLQIETDHIVLEERYGDTLLRRAETVDWLTYYFPRELRTMLPLAGFHIFREQGSIREEVPIDARAGEMVFFCRASQ
ncbi:MAG: class I SAM-dependent methyltransferase [Bacillota bacterium]